MLFKDLQNIGFSKNLALVYVSLYELGGVAKAGEIIQKTKLHRNIVYVSLQKLKEKKLITDVQRRGVAVYKTLDSSRIMNEVREKERLAKQVIEELDALKIHPKTQEVTVHEGIDGFRDHSLSVIKRAKKGDTIRIIDSIGDKWCDLMGEKKYTAYKNLQIQKNIHLLMISYTETTYANPLSKEYPELFELKTIPQPHKNPTQVYIYNDTIALQMFTEPISVIEIKNIELAKMYQNYFDLLWQNTVTTLYGKEGIKTFFDEISTCSEVCWIGGSKEGMDIYFPELAKSVKQRRLENKIRWYDLLDPEGELTGTKTGTSLNDEPYYYFKYLPETVASPHVIGIYNNKVANIIWKDGGLVHIIENKNVADGYQKYFNHLWKQEVHTYSGWDEIELFFVNQLILLEKENTTIYSFGGIYQNTEIEKRVRSFHTNYHQKLVEKKLLIKIMYSEQHKNKIRKTYLDSKKLKLQHIHFRFLPKELDTPLETHIIGKKVITIVWGPNPVATVYENPEILSTFKNQFNTLWKIAKK